MNSAAVPTGSAAPAPPRPTLRASVGTRRKDAAVSFVCADACAASMTSSERSASAAPWARVRSRIVRRSERRRLIEEHDGNVVPHRVAQLAPVAHEARLRLAVFELSLAFGADENGEQLRGERHDPDSLGMT